MVRYLISAEFCIFFYAEILIANFGSHNSSLYAGVKNINLVGTSHRGFSDCPHVLGQLQRHKQGV
jgi:hypothetical protein